MRLRSKSNIAGWDLYITDNNLRKVKRDQNLEVA